MSLGVAPRIDRADSARQLVLDAGEALSKAKGAGQDPAGAPATLRA
ncbi:MAG: hypothetical protein ACRENE_24085 [Polyangiaceae bacterium]